MIIFNISGNQEITRLLIEKLFGLKVHPNGLVWVYYKHQYIPGFGQCTTESIKNLFPI